MSRKKKLSFALVVLTAGVGAIMFYLETYREELRLAFVGFSFQRANVVSTVITNRSSEPVVFSVNGEVKSNNLWRPFDLNFIKNGEMIPGHAAHTLLITNPPTSVWHFYIVYHDSSLPSFTIRIRRKLAEYADRVKWFRLSDWLQPELTSENILSPEIIGDKFDQSAGP